MAKFYLFVFHDVENQLTYSIDDVYEEVDEQYLKSPVYVEIELSLIETHDMDEETLLIHCYRKVIKALITINDWFLDSALYVITVNLRVWSPDLYEQLNNIPMQYIILYYPAFDHVESSTDSAYHTETRSSATIEICVNDDSNTHTYTSTPWTHSRHSFSNITSAISSIVSSIRIHNVDNADQDEIQANEIEDFLMEDYMMEDQDTELVSIMDQESIQDAVKEVDETEEDCSEEDTNYVATYKLYKTFKRN